MSFKDLIKEDLTIFINPDEFGEDHIIDGKVVNVVIDNETLKSRNTNEYDGFIKADILYFAKKEDVLKEPIPENIQLFDGILYKILDVNIDSGVYEVILQGNVN